MITDNGRIITDKLVTVGIAFGYGDVTLTVELNDGTTTKEVMIRLERDDVQFLINELATLKRYDKNLENFKPKPYGEK
jgi:hypothetical protein